MNYILREYKYVITESVLPITEDFVNEFCDYLDDMKCYSIDENHNRVKATLSLKEAEHILSDEYDEELEKHLKVFDGDYGYSYLLDDLFKDYAHDRIFEKGEGEEFIINEDTKDWEFYSEK